MISSEEKRYLQWLTGVMWNGVGDVLEIGPWLGGSTWLLASGMEANPALDSGHRLHVVDNFRWRPFMTERAPLALKADASFRPYFEHNLAPKGDLVVIHEAALADDDSAKLAVPGGVRSPDADLPLFTGKSLNRDLGVVFVDGAKSWMALRHLLKELAPCFVPGETILVFQDYQHWQAFWVPMALAALLESAHGSLELVHVLEFNSVTFRVASRISPEAIDHMPSRIEEVTVEEGNRWLDRAARTLEERGEHGAAAVTKLAGVSFLGTKGAWEDAIATFRTVEARWPRRGAPINQLLAACRWLAEQTGNELPPSARTRRVQIWGRATSAVSSRIPPLSMRG